MAIFGLAMSACSRPPEQINEARALASLSPQFYPPRGWVWTEMEVEGARYRYGVASPPVAPKGDVLIIPDATEPPEIWYETANDLVDRGQNVWILQAAASPRAKGLEPGAGVLRAMIARVIRPLPGRPLKVVGSGAGSDLFLRTQAESPVERITAAVLVSPALSPASVRIAPPPQLEEIARAASSLHLGWITVPNFAGPVTTSHTQSPGDPRRMAMQATWREAQPKGARKPPTMEWVWAYDQTVRTLRTASIIGRVSTPTTILSDPTDLDARRLCLAIPRCRLAAVGGDAHLGSDRQRAVLLDAATAKSP